MPLAAQGVATPGGKSRWDRTTVWGMLRNPAYVGTAGFGKTARSDARPATNRTLRLAGKTRSTNPVTRERDASAWIGVRVPPIIDEQTFELVARRLEDNKRFAARNGAGPAPLRGLLACEQCSYAYYRTSTRTSARKICYYRCIGSDGWRHEGGKICDNRPVRADQLEPLVWEHVTRLLTDPTLIQDELDRRLEQLRAANPATAQRGRLERELARTTTGIARLLEAYQEQLLTLDELRARMPGLRKKEASVRAELDALDAQLVAHDTYLKLAENLDSFLSRLRAGIDGADADTRHRVLRAVVRDILVGPDRVLIRHSIPFRPSGSTPDCLLRWRSHHPSLRRAGEGTFVGAVPEHSGREHLP